MFDKFAMDLFAVGKFIKKGDTSKVSDESTKDYDYQYSLMDFAKDNPLPIGIAGLLLFKAIKKGNKS